VKAKEVIRQARVRCDDMTQPYLRSDALMLLDLTEGQVEAARRARLLVDSTTAAICELEYEAGDVVLDLDPRVIFVRRARISGESRPLQKVRREDLDRERPGWEDETGTPTHIVMGMESRKLRFYPTPSEDGTAYLTVVREPLADVGRLEDDLELSGRHARGLVEWLRHRYYGTQDSETRDDKKAAEALVAFEIEFGPPSRAIDEEWIEQHQGFEEFDGTF
jgi:hypothetical protein